MLIQRALSVTTAGLKDVPAKGEKMGHFCDYATGKTLQEAFSNLHNAMEGNWDYQESGENGNLCGCADSHKTFECEQDAADWLEKNYRPYYWKGIGLAARYKIPVVTASITKQEKRVQELNNEYYKLERDVPHVQNKSAFITCKYCGTRLPSKLWKYNNCPVCKTDLRSKSTLERVAAKKKQAEDAEKKLLEMKRTAKGKYEYIAYGEVHC
jgi:hypothetical protein